MGLSPPLAAMATSLCRRFRRVDAIRIGSNQVRHPGRAMDASVLVCEALDPREENIVPFGNVPGLCERRYYSLRSKLKRVWPVRRGSSNRPVLRSVYD